MPESWRSRPEPPLLELADVGLTYSTRRRIAFEAARHITFTIGQGETVGLVGESGSGKTTIGRVIQGLNEAGSGQIRFEGRDITHLRPKERRLMSRDIQTVFQDPFGSLNPSRTIGGILAEPLIVNEPGLDRRGRAARIASELERVGLPESATRRYPREFSGGQRQRVAIARALIARPRLVISDEAVSALDLSIQAQVLNLLIDLQIERGISYLFISHDLAVVRHIAGRIVVLQRGELIQELDQRVIADQQLEPYTRQLFDAAPIPDPLLQATKRRDFERPSADGRSIPTPLETAV